MLQVEHKGDHLTFASLGLSVDLPYGIMNCEHLPGVFRRYSGKFQSRSSISRDGYLGLLHYIVAKKDKALINRIIKAGWERNWNFDTMPELKSSSDYTNMFPLIPLFYIVRNYFVRNYISFPDKILLSFYCNPPLLNAKTGYRAHLTSIIVLLAMRLGVKSLYHRWIIKTLVKHNPNNPLFNLMHYKLEDKEYDYKKVMSTFEDKIGCHGWGSCEPIVFKKLCELVHNL